MAGPVDKYPNFAQLARHEVEGRDYQIQCRAGAGRAAVMAPHGGRIERGTTPIADAIAGSEHPYYSFEGLKPVLKDNRILHLTSRNFDEPTALELAVKVETVITIHGAVGREVAVYIGGLDEGLKTHTLKVLRDAGVNAEPDPSPTRQGRSPTNICNRGNNGTGMQVELTYGLRGLMFGPPDVQGRRPRTPLFDTFVACVRRVLRERGYV